MLLEINSPQEKFNWTGAEAKSLDSEAPHSLSENPKEKNTQKIFTKNKNKKLSKITK